MQASSETLRVIGQPWNWYHALHNKKTEARSIWQYLELAGPAHSQLAPRLSIQTDGRLQERWHIAGARLAKLCLQ